MAIGTIAIDEPSTIDKLLDTKTLSNGTDNVEREVVVIGSGGAFADYAPVNATDGLKVNLGADNDVTVTSGTITAVTAITNALPAGANAIGKLAANSGVDIGDVDVTTVGTITPGTAASSLGKAEDAAHSSGDVGVMLLAVREATATDLSAGNTDGDYEPLQVDANGALHVIGRANASTNIAQLAGNTISSGNGTTGTGTIRVAQVSDGTGVLAGVTTVTTVTTLANGQTAHDGASTGSPHRVGAKAETALSAITLVADGDATDLYAGVDGVLIVRKHSNLEDVVQERTTNTDGASTAFASGLAAPGANIRLWITCVTVCNSSASFCTVDLRDGSAGSVLWTLPVPATGGVVQVFDPPLKLTANTALAFDASAATSTISISGNGFKSKV